MVPAASDKAPGRKIATPARQICTKPCRVFSAFQQPPSFTNRKVIIARTVKNRNGHGIDDLIMMLPTAKTLQIVGAHQPAEMLPWTALLQQSQRGMGQVCLKAALRGHDPDPGYVGGQLACLRKAFCQRCHVMTCLQRILRADKPPYLVQPKHAVRQTGDMEMTVMRRVEGSAKKTNPQAVTVMKQAGMRVAMRTSAIRQV